MCLCLFNFDRLRSRLASIAAASLFESWWQSAQLSVSSLCLCLPLSTVSSRHRSKPSFDQLLLLDEAPVPYLGLHGPCVLHKFTACASDGQIQNLNVSAKCNKHLSFLWLPAFSASGRCPHRFTNKSAFQSKSKNSPTEHTDTLFCSCDLDLNLMTLI